MHEWEWDLGGDGVVRLVVDDAGVETVYRGPRIVARGSAGVNEHRIPLAPPAASTPESYRQTSSAPRELVLRRTRQGWSAIVDGREIPPHVAPDPIAPARVATRQPPSTIGARVLRGAILGAAIVAAVTGYSYLAPTGYLHQLRERQALLDASHETELTTALANAEGTISVRAPSDFRVQASDATTLTLLNPNNAEVLVVTMLPDPPSVDLDALMRASVDQIRQRMAADPVKGDSFTLAEPSAGSCGGEDGRVLTGTFVSQAGRTFTLWACASIRPGVGIGSHLPPIQAFQYLVPEPVAARDDALLRSMMAATTIVDDAFRPSAPPPAFPTAPRQDPVTFPPSALASPHRFTVTTGR